MHYSVVVAAAESSVDSEVVFGGDDEYCRYLNDGVGSGGDDDDGNVHIADFAVVAAAADETNGTENSNVVVVVAAVAWFDEVDVENFDDDGERYDTAEVAAEMNYGYSHD